MGVRVFALTISALTGQRITDPSFGLRAMRAEVTGAVLLAQPQYQAAELLIGVLAHGSRVTERPASFHKRKFGHSKKGHNALHGLASPGSSAAPGGAAPQDPLGAVTKAARGTQWGGARARPRRFHWGR
jgi:hypothetical protein